MPSRGEQDGLRGATSNPSIFEKAIAGSTDYLDALNQMEGAHDAEPIFILKGSFQSEVPPIRLVPSFA